MPLSCDQRGHLHLRRPRPRPGPGYHAGNGRTEDQGRWLPHPAQQDEAVDALRLHGAPISEPSLALQRNPTRADADGPQKQVE